MYPLLLEDIPSVASLEEQMQVSKTQLPLLQKELQKTYRTTVDHLVEGKRMMKQFAQKKHEFDLLHTKDNSLFASEKTKAKNIRIQLEKELNALVTTTFAPRQKKMKTLLQTIYTQRASIEKKDHQASQARQKFFKTRQKRSKKISRNAEIQQQNEPKEVKKIMTHIQSTAQGTKHLLHALKASTTDKQIDGLIQQYHQVENM